MMWLPVLLACIGTGTLVLGSGLLMLSFVADTLFCSRASEKMATAGGVILALGALMLLAGWAWFGAKLMIFGC